MFQAAPLPHQSRPLAEPASPEGKLLYRVLGWWWGIVAFFMQKRDTLWFWEGAPDFWISYYHSLQSIRIYLQRSECNNIQCHSLSLYQSEPNIHLLAISLLLHLRK